MHFGIFSMQKSSERLAALREYVNQMDAGQNLPLPMELLAMPHSMYATIECIRRMAEVTDANDPSYPAAVNGVFAPENLYAIQKIALVRAIAYVISNGSEEWVVDEQHEEPSPDASETHDLNPYPTGRRCIDHQKNASPVAQLQALPCGIGKTTVIVYFAMLTGRSALILTKTRDQAQDIVRFILNRTNIRLYFDVKYFKANLSDDVAMEKEHARDNGIKATDVLSAAMPNALHVLANGAGILVCDAFLSTMTGAGAKNRIDLARAVLMSRWNTMVVDEVDAVMAPQGRLPFTNGVALYTADEDKVASAETPDRHYYRAMFDYFLGVSGTLFRRDSTGGDVLRAFGRTTYSQTAVAMEERGLLAKLAFRVVRCGGPLANAHWTRAMAHRLREVKAPACSVAKLVVVEQLVKFFRLHGMKVMIFTEHKLEFGMLQTLFGDDAIFVCGAVGEVDDRDEKIIDFLRPVSKSSRTVLCSTAIAGTGFDCPELFVVILLKSNSSGSTIRQRCARSGRALKPRCLAFDIVDYDEHDWVPNAESGLALKDCIPGRYDQFFADGYTHQMQVVDAPQLLDDLRDYVTRRGIVYNGVRLDQHVDVKPFIFSSPLLNLDGENVLMHLIRMLWLSALERAAQKYASVFADCVDVRSQTCRNEEAERERVAKREAAARKQRAKRLGKLLTQGGRRDLAASSSAAPKPKPTSQSRTVVSDLDAIPVEFMAKSHATCGKACWTDLSAERRKRKKHEDEASAVPIPKLIDAVAEAFATAGYERPVGEQAIWEAVKALRKRTNAERAAHNQAFNELRDDIFAAVDDMKSVHPNPPLLGMECCFLHGS